MSTLSWDTINWIIGFVDKQLPNPDQAGCEQAANHWRTCATLLEDAWYPTRRDVASVVDNNHGAAVDAFASYWSRTYLGGTGPADFESVPARLINACRQLADGIDQYYAAVHDAYNSIEHALLDAIPQLGIMAGLTVLTDGLSDEAAAQLADLASSRIGGIVDALGVTIVEVAGKGFTDALFVTGNSVIASGVVDEINAVAFGDPSGKPVGGLTKALEQGGIYEAVNPALKAAADKAITAAAIAGTGVFEESPRLAADIAALPLVVDSTTGEVTTAVTSTAIAQMITNHDINVTQLTEDTTSEQIARIIRGEDAETDEKK